MRRVHPGGKAKSMMSKAEIKKIGSEKLIRLTAL
jgi:hypothetical protein